MKSLRSFILCGALAAASWAMAVPADPTPFIAVQPDGSTLILTRAGDEFCHYFLTEDNQVVVRSEGAYFFAKPHGGTLRASAFMATSPAERTAQQEVFLSGLSRESIDDAIIATRRQSPIASLPASPADAAAAPQRAADHTSSYGIGRFPNSLYPAMGEIKGIVVLVEYTDVKFDDADEAYTYFNGLLNEEGFAENNATGSVRDYFNVSSNGAFDPQFDVYGPVTLPQKREYYGGNKASGGDKNAHKMVMDACDLLKAQNVNFAQYDNNGDGLVDNLFVIFAGAGEADSDEADAIWPHSHYLQGSTWPQRGYKVADNLYVDSYGCTNAKRGDNFAGLGTFVHEFSHVIGLPDLYNTEGSASYTPGSYSVLDGGSYNNNSHTPPTYSSFERNAMGWTEPELMPQNAEFSLQNLASTNHCYIIPTSKASEFFLLENRQQSGWDKYLPFHGMLVWHIDYDSTTWFYNSVNNDKDHQRVDIVEAAGRTGYTNTILRSYPFPGSKKITELAYPELATWADKDTGYSLTAIKEAGGAISGVSGELSGIESVLGDGVTLKIDMRTIRVEGVDPSEVSIYDSMGRTISSGAAEATVAPGIYLVKAGAKVTKTIVR